jgi:hypothetical protein
MLRRGDNLRCILRTTCNGALDFLISRFRCVLNAVFFLLGDSAASEFYLPTFRNPLSIQSSQVVHVLWRRNRQPMKIEQAVPKRRHIKFRRRGITQKKEHNTLHFLVIQWFFKVAKNLKATKITGKGAWSNMFCRNFPTCSRLFHSVYYYLLLLLLLLNSLMEKSKISINKQMCVYED